MPTVLKRLAGPPACPIVVAQYKDEYRGVGHERDLHWALVVITDRDTLSGPGTNAIRADDCGGENDGENEREYEIQWYTRCAPASLYDVSATVRSLCLGGVQVGAVRRADVDKLGEYLRSHPPVPTHSGWSSRDYVLELLELLRPFKMLRPDLQGIHLKAPKGAQREVVVDDLLPELREVGRVTQESIFREEFRPCVLYSS
ncbi:hypothetical protein C8Q74DRAFT_1207937 [Fomes fomentarius]|nr:hypothetical protein C8Q74DRAFT_1207937 [Fomes fomentarius]